MRINGLLIFALSGVATWLLFSDKGKELIGKLVREGINGKIAENKANLDTRVEIGNNSSFSVFGN